MTTIDVYPSESAATRGELHTDDLQSAIDRCAAFGGGVVHIRAGVFRIGTLRLASKLTLKLDRGAVLIGSDQLSDYKHDSAAFVDAVGQPRGRCLILAEDVHDVAIVGDGVIDGSGSSFAPADRFPGRPFLVRFIRCRNALLEDLTLQNSAAWCLHLMDCDNVLVNNLRISSRVNENNDGIDIDSSRQVTVTNCEISTGDDAICLKATLDRPCEGIRVDNCTLRSGCGAIKFGTESYGDIRRVEVSNCRIEEAGLGGIKILSVDGGMFEDIDIHDIEMRAATGPIFVRLGARLRTYVDSMTPKPVGRIRNVSIRRLRAELVLPAQDGVNFFTRERHSPHAFVGILITGIPGERVEDVRLSDILIRAPGGGPVPNALPSEQVEQYPEQFYFGTLPAHCVFLRHARRLTLHNVRMELASADARPPVVEIDTTDCKVEVESVFLGQSSRRD